MGEILDHRWDRSGSAAGQNRVCWEVSDGDTAWEVYIMKKVMEVVVSKVELDVMVEAIMGDVKTSKSGKMKAMFNLGMEVMEIALIMGVRYNFVYNVVSNMIIVEGVQVETEKKESKKDNVFLLLDGGATVKEIAVTLKTNYNYIYKLKKEWEALAVLEAVLADKVEVVQ
jgi:hypothetical protein